MPVVRRAHLPCLDVSSASGAPQPFQIVDLFRSCPPGKGGSRAGVVGIYQRHDWAEEKRAALDAWSAQLLAAAEGRLTAVKVLPFSRARSGEM